MSGPQLAVGLILALMIALFVWDRFRHDLVAAAALLACVFAGVVPPAEAFAGFGHPAVVTVAAVLILSGVLQGTGAAEALMRAAMPADAGPRAAIVVLMGLAAVMSAFMNNVGALALLMPLALQAAGRHGLAAGRVLMPLAFGSILGGMTTLIGTPPNLIVAGFRAQAGAPAFAMFDFTPVGLLVTAAGLAFIALGGWRLVPDRRRAGPGGFDIGAYLTEVRVPDTSRAAGMTLNEIERLLEEVEAPVVGLVRDNRAIPVPDPFRRVRAGDILVIEADPSALRDALGRLDLKLEEDKPTGGADGAAQARPPGSGVAGLGAARERVVQSGEAALAEMVLLSDSGLIGRRATDLRLRTVYHINLLAVSRKGGQTVSRLRSLALAAGDVLLLQGEIDALSDFAARFGCAPLAPRPLELPSRRKALAAGAVMAAAVAATAAGLATAALAFTAAALAAVVLKLIPARRLYESVDWPVVVLLGALMPVAQAVANTGLAAWIGEGLVQKLAAGAALPALGLILLATIALTSFMSNAATAAVMCPVAISCAESLAARADPFLMAVAVGASCAFLTPISHQNNTLILGPGGFRFGDYWPLGLPLELIVVALGLPAILFFWPL